jgi:hypothetical protein
MEAEFEEIAYPVEAEALVIRRALNIQKHISHSMSHPKQGMYHDN